MNNKIYKYCGAESTSIWIIEWLGSGWRSGTLLYEEEFAYIYI